MVKCEMACTALGTNANMLATVPLGAMLTVKGFVAAKSCKVKTPVLHVNEIEFEEGNQDGF